MRPEDLLNQRNFTISSTVPNTISSGVRSPEPRDFSGWPITQNFHSPFKKQAPEFTINWISLGGAKFPKSTGDKLRSKKKKRRN
jgi:hypothetical protein